MKDAAVQDADHWRIALQMWTNLVESEEFWSGFRDVEELSDFEPLASLEDFDQLKAESLQLVTEPIAQLARDAASRSEFDRCRRALRIVRTALPSEIGSAIEESVFGPYEDNLVRNSKEITKRCWADIRQDRASAKSNEKPCEAAVDRWKQELEPRYRDFVAMAGTRSVAGLRVRQEYGDFLAGLGNALTWADHWIEAERLMSLALSCLPPDSPARERIEGAISRFSGEASQERERERTRQQELELQRFESLCQDAPSDISQALKLAAAGASTAAVQVCERAYQRYDKTVLPWLSTIRAADSEIGPRCLSAKAAAARCLLRIADGFRRCDEPARASDLMVVAAELAAQDSETLAEIARHHSSLALKSRTRTASEAPGNLNRSGSPDGEGVEERRRRKDADIEKFEGLCEEVRATRATMCEQAYQRYENTISPWLARIITTDSETSPHAVRARAAAAACLLAIAEGFQHCDDRGKASNLMAAAAELAPENSYAANEIARRRAQLYGEIPRRTPPQTVTGSGQSGDKNSSIDSGGTHGSSSQVDDPPSVAGFLQLCKSLLLECRREIQASRGTAGAIRVISKTISGDYEREAEPWMATILASCGSNREIVTRVRDAAAECLYLMAHEFACKDDYDAVCALASKALPLTSNGGRLREEVTRQLARAKKQRSASEPGSSRTVDAGSSSGARRTTSSTFSKAPDSRIRRPLVIVVGIAILAAIPLLIKSINSPKWEPSIADLELSSKKDPPTVTETHDPVSLPNGTNLIPLPSTAGRGQFKISNYTNKDAVVKLKTADDQVTLRLVYVRAMSDLTIPKIPVGNYVLEFATGRDWDVTTGSFRQDCAFSKFEEPFIFSETREANKIWSSINSVTLHAVPNGTARTEAISAEDFGGGGVKRPEQ
jgi:hypothetical protein